MTYTNLVLALSVITFIWGLSEAVNALADAALAFNVRHLGPVRLSVALARVSLASDRLARWFWALAPLAPILAIPRLGFGAALAATGMVLVWRFLRPRPRAAE